MFIRTPKFSLSIIFIVAIKASTAVKVNWLTKMSMLSHLQLQAMAKSMKRRTKSTKQS